MEIFARRIILFAAVALLLMLNNLVAFADTQFYLNLETDPSDVLAIDPNAVTGEGYYASGSWVVIDAKQTVTSEAVSYEFVQWSTTDNSQADPEDLAELTGNQALLFMDSDRTVTAIYEAHYSYYLDLETAPSQVLTIDPAAVTGEGYYESGMWVIIDAKQTVASGTVRYEFVAWSTQDTWEGDPEDEPVLVGNQALVFMDSDRIVTAIYEEFLDVTWEWVFADEVRGTVLRLSTDDGHFQFLTPEEDYGARQTDGLLAQGSLVTIWHSDPELILAATAILNPRIDFCLAFAIDRQTGQIYTLRDRIGME